MKNNKYLLREFFWLMMSFLATLIFAGILFRMNFKHTIDVHLHDTYFVFSKLSLMMAFFLVVSFVVFMIKEKRNSFSETFPNWIILIVGCVLVFDIGLLITQISPYAKVIVSGYTIYPPLSGLPGGEPLPAFTENIASKVLTNSLILFQSLVILLLLYFTYKWGKRKCFS